ncbi:MAG TPA: glycosyltransferase, partial [Myxococcota bacterium]|nr:glycosyltransferase [Myxococcota bacterium]
MRVALVHDWLTGMRGGERVLEALCGMFPGADVHTLVHVPGATSPAIESHRIVASPLSRIPGVARHYRKLLPLFPWAAGRLEIAGYDLVVSTSHAFAKGVRVPAGTPHVCYCFTPMRYVWDQIDTYLGRGALRAAAMPLVAALRRWDRRTSAADRITRVIAISETVRERVRRCWGREASVIHPPVDVAGIRPDGAAPDPFFLLVGAFVPYKRESLVIEAFRGLDAELRVAGDGPLRAALQAEAPANVRFLGRVPDAELARLYARCRALVYPQVEDFGIVAVEAQAAGRPVVAFGAGGATETVVGLDDATPARPATGIFFHAPTPEALRAAIARFEVEEKRFDPAAIRRHAEAFSLDRFRTEMGAALDATVAAARTAAG